MRERFGLPVDGGPSIAGAAAILLAAGVGAGLVGWPLALPLAGLLLWLRWRSWRPLAQAERAAAALAGLDAPVSIPAAVRRIAARIGPIEHRLAEHHPVTGLPMREQLFAEMARDFAASPQPRSLGVLRFASYDRLAGFDRATAESALAALAQRLAAAIRNDHFLAQIDRDCFAIWLRGTASEALLAEFRALAFIVEQEVEAEGTMLRPTIDSAVVSSHEGENAPAALLARGLAALAPGGGGGAVAPTPLSPDEVRERYLIERDLALAVEDNQLVLFFQPVVNLALGKLVGAEALLRWTHPTLGPVSPARFIPIMEAAGLSDIFGLWVLNAAAREAARWREHGLGDLKMAVNLSARQFLDPALARKIVRTIERHRVDPACIELELTETAAMADAARTQRVFSELRATGMSLAIDDFGTGYSSLSYLKNLPFDKLKIDREFVTDVQHRRDSRAICGALIELGRGLDLSVLAEGVECEEEVAALRELGCHIFQGYHFARPMTGDAFRAIAVDPAFLGRLASPVHRQLESLEKRMRS